MPLDDDHNDAPKLSPIQGYWLMFSEEQRSAVIQFCECLAHLGETADSANEAARLLLARRNGGT